MALEQDFERDIDFFPDEGGIVAWEYDRPIWRACNIDFLRQLSYHDIHLMFDSPDSDHLELSPPENESYYVNKLLLDGTYPLSFRYMANNSEYLAIDREEALAYKRLRALYAKTTVDLIDKGVWGKDMESYLSGFTILMQVIYSMAQEGESLGGEVYLLDEDAIIKAFEKIEVDRELSAALFYGLAESIEIFLPYKSNGEAIVSKIFSLIR